MKEYFFIEGHKNKTDYGVEDTLILDDHHAYDSEEKVMAKAQENFEKTEELSLVVIYKGVKRGDKYATKYIFRNQDGQLDEVDHWWSDQTCC